MSRRWWLNYIFKGAGLSGKVYQIGPYVWEDVQLLQVQYKQMDDIWKLWISEVEGSYCG